MIIILISNCFPDVLSSVTIWKVSTWERNVDIVNELKRSCTVLDVGEEMQRPIEPLGERWCAAALTNGLDDSIITAHGVGE